MWWKCFVSKKKYKSKLPVIVWPIYVMFSAKYLSCRTRPCICHFLFFDEKKGTPPERAVRYGRAKKNQEKNAYGPILFESSLVNLRFFGDEEHWYFMRNRFCSLQFFNSK